MGRRRGLPLTDCRLGEGKLEAFGHLFRHHQGIVRILFIGTCADAAAEGAPDALPPHLHNALTFCSEVMPGTLDMQDGFLIYAGIVQRAEQSCTDQKQKIMFAGGQRPDSCLLTGHRGRRDQRMVIRHLGVIDNRFNADCGFKAICKRQYATNSGSQLGQPGCHVMRQIPAVGSRIGQQLLFIQSLGVVERLLRREAVELVRVPLQAGQVIQRRRVLVALRMLHRLHDRRAVIAGIHQPARFVEIVKAFRFSAHVAPGIQHDLVEGLRPELCNGLFSLREHGQRRGHDAPDVQCRAVKQGVQARGVHADEPIRLGAAKRCLIQIVVGGHGLHGAESLADGAFLH